MGGNAKFTKKKHKERYAILLTCKTVPYKHIDNHVIDTLPLAHYWVLVVNLGWDTYFSIHYPTYYELTREFYATYEFNYPKDITTDTPRFNLTCGFISSEFAHSVEYEGAPCNFPDNFDLTISWPLLFSDDKPYHTSTSRSTYLRPPDLWYIHCFLSMSFSGINDDSFRLSKTEFFFLFCMEHSIKINLTAWLGRQFLFMAKKKRGHLCLGSIITFIVIKLGVLDMNKTNMHIAYEMEPLDFDCLHKMRVIYKEKEKHYCIAPPGPDLAPQIICSKHSRPTATEFDEEATPSNTSISLA
ncbi:unnamed protein product [Dovyalis caffra]|uniref:Uncharacterized protein n=1 Tax=Dovyalis caffra TaxID=77055 RepID=A0AAV1SQL1_9ROSI|nr:unnamed protein product [Dovyalis caffra]